MANTKELTAVEKDEIDALCNRAFADEFGSLFRVVESADHVVARIDSRLVGHAVWSTRWLQAGSGELLRTAYVDAVATEPSLWGQGVGRRVMKRVVAETQDFDALALATDIPAFYERLGWEPWAGSLGARKNGMTVPTPGEHVFILRTPRTPALDPRSELTVEWRDGQPW